MSTTPHNRFFSRLIATISILALVVVGVAPSTTALAVDPLDVISYQGRLLNTNGVPVTDASLEMVFRFYDDIAAGTCLWESDDGAACDGVDETQTVALTDGLFSENIGSTDDPAGLSEAYPVDLTGVFEDDANVFLEVQIAGEILSPRKRIAATPFALNSQTLDGLDSTEIVLWEAGANGTYEDDAAVIVGPDVAETLSNGGFSLAGNNDLFVGDLLGIEGDVYTDGDIFMTSDGINDMFIAMSLPSGPVDWAFGSENTGNGDFIISRAADLSNPAIQIDEGTLDINLSNDLVVTGGDIIAGIGATTFNLINNTSTTVNFAGSATTVEIGAATGTTSINNALAVDGSTTLGNGVGADLVTINTASSTTNAVTVTANSLDDDDVFGVTANALTTGSLMDFATSGTFSGDLFQMTATGAASGTFINLISSNAGTATRALNIDFEETTATQEIMRLVTDVGGNDIEVFSIEADGEVFSSVGFTVGATTTYADNSIQSSGSFSFNTTANQTISTGTGLFTAGGALSVNGDTTIGNAVTDALTVNAEIRNFTGSNALEFEGATNDGIYTIFAITDPSAERTITFQNGSGTVAFLSDVGGSGGWTDDGTTVRLTTATDHVGIGTATAIADLDLAGNLRTTGKATAELTGSIDPTASTSVTGVLTLFTTELVVGDRITVTGETRTVVTILSDTSLTVDEAFSDNANDTDPDVLYAIASMRDSSGALRLVVNDKGRVGINTASPGHVSAGSEFGSSEFEIQASSDSDNSTNLLIASLGPTASTASIDFSVDSLTAVPLTNFSMGATDGGGGATNWQFSIGTSDMGTEEFLTLIDFGGNEGVVFNEDSIDRNFRIEGATNTNMFTIDGGTDTMALGSDVLADTALYVNFPAPTVSANGDGYYTYFSPALTESGVALDVHDRMFGVNIEGLQLTDDVDVTTTNTATLRVGNAPIGLVTPATNSYALWVEMAAQNDSTALYVDHSSTYFADATVAGKSVGFNRTLVEDDFADPSVVTLAVTAPLVQISNTMTEGTDDIINDSSNVLYIEQNFVDATGAVVNIYSVGQEADVLNIDGTVTGTSTVGMLGTLVQAADTADDTDINAVVSLQAWSSSSDVGDTLYGLDIKDLIAADGDSSTHALYIGDTWDTQIFLDDTTSIFRLVDAATLTFDDGTNTLMTLTDTGTTGTLAVNGILNATFATANADRLCWDAAGESDITDCTGTPGDYAEYYGTTDASISAGDIVVVDSSQNAMEVAVGGRLGSKSWVLKSSQAYSPSIVGIVSTDPNEVIGDNFTAGENPRAIALNGRLPLKVNDSNGAIAIGDPITSSAIPGVGMKATMPGRIVGHALSSWSGVGQGTIIVWLQPGWHSGSTIATDGTMGTFTDDFAFTSTGTASAATLGFDSHALSLRGSGWDGAAAQAVAMKMVNDVTDATDYRLSIRNTSDTEVAYVTDDGLMRLAGDLVIGGRLYPSDRGTAQTSKYIYYDGSAGGGGDRMRTNAAGWGTGSYDFAEMFPSLEQLVPGDVVVFSAQNEHVERSTSSYNTKLAGIVSTQPGFLAGENRSGDFPIALAGRVPTKVTVENGSIEVGDPLTSSSQPGYAMKATQAGPIVGYALEPYSTAAGQDDSIIVFVNVSYYGGGTTSATPGVANTASQTGTSGSSSNFSSLNMDGDIYMHGHHILNVGRMTGIASRWSIEEDGTVKTEGVLKTIITSYQNEKVETAAVTSPDVMITLVGTGELNNGQAVIAFETISPTFNDVTSTVAPVRVVVTPNGPVSLYVTGKSNNGFTVQQVGGMDTGITFDWMVSAYRKDYEPVETLIVGEEPPVDPTATDPAATDPAITDPAPVDPAPADPAPTDPAPSESPTTPPADSTTPVDGGTPAETPTAP